MTSLFRAAAISMMATADDPEVVKQCITRVQATVKDVSWRSERNQQ